MLSVFKAPVENGDMTSEKENRHDLVPSMSASSSSSISLPAGATSGRLPQH